MDDHLGYQNSWDGFVDYISCYHTVHPLWIATGACIFAGTIIGLIPQIFRIIKLRSSHGISPLSVFVTNINQLFVVLNIFCLHSADFYGMLQISPLRTIPRQLTFANVFILWFAYLPIVFLFFIFYDKSEKLNRTSTSITKEWHLTKILSVLLVVFSVILYLIFLFLYLITGSTSYEILSYGKLLGTFSTIVTVCQYIPQFITTWKLKDNGSFSLVTLCIQAPGGTLNAIFMIIGNNENWTTWLSTFTAAVQQWLLLGLIIFYKIKRRRNKKNYMEINTEKMSNSVTVSENYDPVD